MPYTTCVTGNNYCYHRHNIIVVTIYLDIKKLFTFVVNNFHFLVFDFLIESIVDIIKITSVIIEAYDPVYMPYINQHILPAIPPIFITFILFTQFDVSGIMLAATGKRLYSPLYEYITIGINNDIIIGINIYICLFLFSFMYNKIKIITPAKLHNVPASPSNR